MQRIDKIKAVLFALIIQIGFLGLFFIGGLLDPLLLLWAAALYFFIVGTYLIYYYWLTRLFKIQPNK